MPTSETAGKAEENELNGLLSLFKDSSDDIQQKRQQVAQMISENSISSFPSEMSMLTALDELLHCFALGGQFKNYYRYGTYSTCERERQKFWFAVKNGTVMEARTPVDIDSIASNPKEVERRTKIQAFFKQRLLEDKARGSSEDIWDAREKLLNRPFNEDN